MHQSEPAPKSMYHSKPAPKSMHQSKIAHEHEGEEHLPDDNILTIEHGLQKIMTLTKLNLQQDQLTTEFGSEFNETQLDYDQTSLPTPTINPKIDQTSVHETTHTSEPRKDNNAIDDLNNDLLGDENDDDDLGLGVNSKYSSLSKIFEDSDSQSGESTSKPATVPAPPGTSTSFQPMAEPVQLTPLE